MKATSIPSQCDPGSYAVIPILPTDLSQVANFDHIIELVIIIYGKCIY